MAPINPRTKRKKNGRKEKRKTKNEKNKMEEAMPPTCFQDKVSAGNQLHIRIVVRFEIDV